MTETQIHVRDAKKKIKFCDQRIKLLVVWDAPDHLRRLKDHCISTLRNRVIFLQDHGAFMKNLDHIADTGEMVKENINE